MNPGSPQQGKPRHSAVIMEMMRAAQLTEATQITPTHIVHMRHASRVMEMRRAANAKIDALNYLSQMMGPRKVTPNPNNSPAKVNPPNAPINTNAKNFPATTTPKIPPLMAVPLIARQNKDVEASTSDTGIKQLSAYEKSTQIAKEINKKLMMRKAGASAPETKPVVPIIVGQSDVEASPSGKGIKPCKANEISTQIAKEINSKIIVSEPISSFLEIKSFKTYYKKSNQEIRNLLTAIKFMPNKKKSKLLEFFNHLETSAFGRYKNLYPSFQVAFDLKPRNFDAESSAKIENSAKGIIRIAPNSTVPKLVFLDDEEWAAEEEEDKQQEGEEVENDDDIKEPFSKKSKITECASTTLLSNPFSDALSGTPENNPFLTFNPFSDALLVTPEKEPILTAKPFSDLLSVKLEDKPFSAACEQLKIKRIPQGRKKRSRSFKRMRTKLRRALSPKRPMIVAGMEQGVLISFLRKFYLLSPKEKSLINEHMQNVKRQDPVKFEILRKYLRPFYSKIQHNNTDKVKKLNTDPTQSRYDPFQISEPDEEDDSFKSFDLALQNVSTDRDPFKSHIKKTSNNYSNAHNSFDIPTQSQLRTRSNYIDLVNSDDSEDRRESLICISDSDDQSNDSEDCVNDVILAAKKKLRDLDRRTENFKKKGPIQVTHQNPLVVNNPPVCRNRPLLDLPVPTKWFGFSLEPLFPCPSSRDGSHHPLLHNGPPLPPRPPLQNGPSIHHGPPLHNGPPTRHGPPLHNGPQHGPPLHNGPHHGPILHNGPQIPPFNNGPSLHPPFIPPIYSPHPSQPHPPHGFPGMVYNPYSNAPPEPYYQGPPHPQQFYPRYPGN